MKELNVKDLTPMMKHWFSVKERYKVKYPNHLIAYRMGDFYEFFYDDAVRVSNLLGITLTKRRSGGDSYPLAGIPHHAGSYLKNLVNLGQTVVDMLGGALGDINVAIREKSIFLKNTTTDTIQDVRALVSIENTNSG